MVDGRVGYVTSQEELETLSERLALGEAAPHIPVGAVESHALHGMAEQVLRLTQQANADKPRRKGLRSRELKAKVDGYTLYSNSAPGRYDVFITTPDGTEYLVGLTTSPASIKELGPASREVDLQTTLELADAIDQLSLDQ
jgi:hypothetical protein